MKKIFVMLLAAMMLFAFTACNDKPAASIVKETVDQDTTVSSLWTFVGEFQEKRASLSGEEEGDKSDAELVNAGFPTSFIEVADVNGEPSSITMFGKIIKAGDKARIDINNNVFLVDEAFKVIDGKLSVNAFYLFYTYAIGEDFSVDNEVVYSFEAGELNTLDSLVQWDRAANENSKVKLTTSEEWKGKTDDALEGAEFDVIVGDKNHPLYSWYEGQVNTDVSLNYVEYQYSEEEKADSWKLAFLGSGEAGMNQSNVNYFYGWDDKNPTAFDETDNPMTVICNGVVFDSEHTAKGIFNLTFNVRAYSAVEE